MKHFLIIGGLLLLTQCDETPPTPITIGNEPHLSEDESSVAFVLFERKMVFRECKAIIVVEVGGVYV